MKNKIYVKSILFALISFYNFSCSNSHNNGGEMKYVYNKPSIEINKDSIPIKFDLLNIKEYSDFYSNLDSIKLIKLETSDESLIGTISRIFIVDDLIFVADYSITKSIFAFDFEGNYLYKINKIGGGPGEYQNLNMVHIDNENIFILDWISWKIIKYDLLGNLVFEQRTNPNPEDFININNEEMIFGYSYYREDAFYQTVFVNKELEAEDTAFPFKNTRELACSPMSMFQKLSNDKVLYYYPFCDTIFEIKNKNIYPKYHLSLYHSNQVSSFFEATKDMNERNYYKRLMGDDIVRSFDFIELKDNLYINYSKGMQSYTTLISKKSLNSYHSVAGDAKKRIAYQPFYVNGHFENALLASIDESFISELTKENKDLFYSNLIQKDIELIRVC